MERIDVLAALGRVPAIRFEHVARIDLTRTDLCEVGTWISEGLTPRVSNLAVSALKSHEPDAFRQSLEDAQCRVIGIQDSDYPAELLQLFSPPLVLYVRGSLPRNWSMAVVGTRKPTPYGRQAVEAIVPFLVASEVGVISGLAHGIDTLTHVVTLRCGGTAVAVLGSGLARVYPSANRALSERIISSGGAVISEYPPLTPPLAHHFPARNRLVSGLSRGVIVVEGDLRSGSMITASHALDQGRDVFAVPGSIFSTQSKGPNQLIAQGAIPLLSPATLQHHYGLKEDNPSDSQLAGLSEEDKLIVNALCSEPCDVDEITLHVGLPVTIVAARLVELEIMGMIARQPGGLYLLLKNG